MKSSVIAILKGGLGNQLFIYAAARALALRCGRDLYLDAELGFIGDDYERSYCLDRFSISAARMPEAWSIAPTLKHPKHKVVRALSKLLPRAWRGYYAERRRESAAQLTSLEPKRSRITLLGYWQDEEYFAARADEIWQELQPPPPDDEVNRSLGREMAACESVFLHVRRVRYPKRLDANYYQQAVDQALQQCANPRFLILGDAPGWVVGNVDFRGADTRLVTHNSTHELADLWLMTQCRHAIIANSSFSWWGAWLGDRQRKVWAPSHPGFGMVMCKRWNRLENQLETGAQAHEETT